ncbi:MAG: beta-ketoacyl-[acyl-carrier-protein] synthase II [Dehalococcoidales bacterium]|nr:beta-ketoacyl-[acyl-carrier-protein] synthase II [Dehalococcoidales bacterium]
MNNRVVVTGIGVVSPLGLNATTTWEGLIAGKSGIDYITLFNPKPFETKFAGEVKGFNPTDYISRKAARHMDRYGQLAVAASLQAVEQAGIKIDHSNHDNFGVIIGTASGGMLTLNEQLRILDEKGPDRISPFLAPMMAADMASAQVSILLGARGPNFCTTSSCSSSSDAIGVACEFIKCGDAQAMIAGGSEAVVTPIGIAAFNACKALSTRNSQPQQASRPFDAERNGFVLSEGAAVLILEDLAFAQRRGAKILAEIIGYGVSADASHVTQPDKSGEGAARAMKMALNKAGLGATEVDYINAHGTSTPLNDKAETAAIKAVFGDLAYKIPVSSTKSMIGHLLGGAGAIEAAVCIMVVQHGIIPPTINHTHPDPGCDLDYVPNVARQAKVATALSNSLGFGGHNSVLIFRQYGEA